MSNEDTKSDPNLFEIECNARPVSAALEKRGGKWKVRVEFEIVDGEKKGKRVAWDGKLDDNNIKWTKINLGKLGWQGQSSKTIEADVMKEPKTVPILTRIASYTNDKGKLSQWTSVDRIFGGAAKPADPITNDDYAAVDGWFANVDTGEAAPPPPSDSNNDLPF